MKRQRRSQKHHFLPIKYQEAFTDESGEFCVYDKIRDEFKTKQRPSNRFFKNNLNTVELPDGRKTDYLESYYTKIENDFWGVLDRLRLASADESPAAEDLIKLLFFLHVLHWRLPVNSEKIREIEDLHAMGGSLNFLREVLNKKYQVPENVIDRYQKSDVFKQTIKVLLPHSFISQNQKWYEEIYNWKFYYPADDQGWYFIGDNPLITTGENDFDSNHCLDQFIFPISARVLLVASKGMGAKSLPADFIIDYAIAVIERSERFVACPNESWLRAMVDHYRLHKTYDKTKIIIPGLFEYFR